MPQCLSGWPAHVGCSLMFIRPGICVCEWTLSVLMYDYREGNHQKKAPFQVCVCIIILTCILGLSWPLAVVSGGRFHLVPACGYCAIRTVDIRRETALNQAAPVCMVFALLWKVITTQVQVGPLTSSWTSASIHRADMVPTGCARGLLPACWVSKASEIVSATLSLALVWQSKLAPNWVSEVLSSHHPHSL